MAGRRSVSLILLSILVLGACASTRKADPDSRTGGLMVDMLAERPGASLARYLVEQDGTISFAGGIGAWEETYTWTGDLTDDEIEALRRLVSAGEWFSDPPRGDDGTGHSRYTIRARQPGDYVQFVVEGDHPRVMGVYEVISQAARRRHQRFLDALPKASEQPR